MSSRRSTDGVADLGDVRAAGSRQRGRRSSVCRTDGRIVVGRADGSLLAFDGDLEEAWHSDAGTGSVVSLAPFDGGVLAGERGPDGEVRLHDGDTGRVRWRYRTADDVGDPAKDTRFRLPFVVDLATDGDRAYAAARRYERGDDGSRTFESVVSAFDRDGEVAWRYRTDASPIALDRRDDRLAVAFNRCPGDHRDGLVVLDATSGAVRRRWDPPGDGQRRVGDLSLIDGGAAVASHADYRGYRLDGDGVRWSIDLGRPVERGDDTVYAYPNHVHATDAGAVFLTGNTYPDEGRETDARHPNEHAAVGVAPDGDRRWSAAVGGFSHGIATAGDRVAVPVAQHFRERDPAAHGVALLDVSGGPVAERSTGGVVTAVSVGEPGVTADDGAGEREERALAAVEEPVEYHDGDRRRGEYRLRRESV